MPFPAEVFNRTLDEHYDEVLGWFGKRRNEASKARRERVRASWWTLGGTHRRRGSSRWIARSGVRMEHDHHRSGVGDVGRLCGADTRRDGDDRSDAPASAAWNRDIGSGSSLARCSLPQPACSSPG